MSKYQSTQIMIAFQVDGDRERELITLLTTLVRLVTLLWRSWQRVTGMIRETIALWGDATQAARFTVTVFSIGFTALLWGIGVKL